MGYEEDNEMNEIIFEDADIGVKGRILLSGINAKLNDGLYILLGPNGSGKSTLLKTVAGLYKPINGRITVNGFEPYRLKRKKAAGLIAYTWQNPYYGFIEARVLDEINFILKVLGVGGNWVIVEKLVPRELYDRDPYTLSGGEARRVSLASVLVADQPIWLLDEPFNDLDYEGVKALIDVIMYGREKGKLIIIATHMVSLMDNLKPDYFMLIKRNGELVIDEWSRLHDEQLVEVGVVPRRMMCVSYLNKL